LGAKEGLPFVLAKLRLLVLLYKVAARAAASVTFSITILLVRGKIDSPGTQTVLASVALEAVSLAYVVPLHHLQNPLHSTVSETVPAAAVSVEEGPALQLRIFMQAVMDTTIDDAGKTCEADCLSVNTRSTGLESLTPGKTACCEGTATISARRLPFLHFFYV